VSTIPDGVRPTPKKVVKKKSMIDKSVISFPSVVTLKIIINALVFAQNHGVAFKHYV